MKILIENWRKFLKEQSEPLGDLALFAYKKRTHYTLILYRLHHEPELNGDIISVVGAITLGQTGEPCIPLTLQVETVYVDEPYRGLRIGSLLYDLAFLFAHSTNSGLTSDKVTGTNTKAANMWNSMATSGDYEKRKTAQGNDKFDYTGRETPLDPNDDCDEPALADKNATDHSLTKKTATSVAPKYREMTQRHKENIQKILDSEMLPSVAAFETYLTSQADADFETNYINEPD
jgi:GNAT superfamily N-acetyltransferase